MMMLIMLYRATVQSQVLGQPLSSPGDVKKGQQDEMPGLPQHTLH